MKKFLSILLVSVMLLTPLAISANAEPLQLGLIQEAPVQSKITNELSTYLESVENDEYVEIYVWLNDYGEDMLYQALSQRLKTTISADTEDAYVSDRVSVKKQFLKEGLERLSKSGEYNTLSKTGKIEIQALSTNEFRKQALIPEVMTDMEIKTCIESGMTSDEIINLSERTQFLKEYRATRKTLNASVNNTFYSQLNLNKCKNVYLDPLLTRVTMQCKKSYVSTLEDLDIVREIGYYVDFEFMEESAGQRDTAPEPVDITDGYDMYACNIVDGTTYTGAGIKVGVIEIGWYDEDAPHLENKSITNYAPISTGVGTNHGTAVLSILAGDTKTYNDGTITRKYQGVAPGATLYFAGESLYESTTRTHLSWMINNSCHVINMSLGLVSDGRYTSYEQYIDNLILEYRVVIAIAAGNNSDEDSDATRNKIINPAMAYNAISVGNVDYTSVSNGKYSMNGGSRYMEHSNILANKPDVSAFGTKIKMLNSNGIPSNCFPVAINPSEEDYVSGTSFAAPQIAGAAALMMQANFKLIGKPDAIKAILVESAEESKISTTNNSTKGNDPVTPLNQVEATNLIRNKSGAGLLNIVGAIQTALSGRIVSFRINPFTASLGTYWESEFYYFEADRTIELALVFEKVSTTLISSTTPFDSDLSIDIVNEEESSVMTSVSETNNVELCECTFKESGNYKFRISIQNNNYSNEAQTNYKRINTSFVFGCNCETSTLTTHDFAINTHVVKCDTCNTALFRESHSKYELTDTFGFYGIHIKHTLYAKSTQRIDCYEIAHYSYLRPYVYSITDGTITCQIDTEPFFSDYISDTEYLVRYGVSVFKNGTKIDELITDVVFVYNPLYGTFSAWPYS